MEDTKLLKISFIVAAIGLGILIVLGNVITLEESNIAKLDKKSLDKNVKIKGYIQNIQSSGSVKLLEIEDNTGKIIVVVFDNKLYVKKGNIAEVEGKLTIREGKLQVNAETIRTIQI
ncbi:MAG: OB-fold nucleic acid binding domain-containing protein [Nanoarchaeota archaeon]